MFLFSSSRLHLQRGVTMHAPKCVIFLSHPVVFSHQSPRASESLVNSARVNYPVFPIYSQL